MAGYLFVHFTGEQKDGEQIYFSISRDGLHWEDLNDGQPVLYSHLGMQGVRDPFLLRDPKQKKFYLIATDLRIEAGEGWDTAQYRGSRDLIVWESKDLVHWSAERASTIGVPGAGCVWAPEGIYDSKREQFLVFWASMVKLSGDTEAKQRIYASWTSDFQSFSEPFIYMERKEHVIDTTMVESEGVYYRISKDETNKCLLLESCDSLTGNFQEIPSETLSSLFGVEGPECYLLPDQKTWCLIADQFAEGKGYLPLLTDDLSSGKFRILKEKEYALGKTKKRHGGVLAVTDEELALLERFFDHKKPVVEGLFADPDLACFDGTYYLYPTTDGFTDWSGTKFSVFASKDLRKFQKAADIFDMADGDVPWAVGSAWAPCIAEKDGKYYYYFCGKRVDGKSCIGAAVSDYPEGPFVPAAEPMITMEMMETYQIQMSQTIDPSIYQENGETYLLFGNGYAAIAKLTPDAESIESINQNCEQILTRVTRDLSCFLASFGEDGACMEGLGYWEYGMSYFSMFAELLKEKTGGKTDLLDGKKQRKIMEFQQKCYFPGGNTLSFSDGDSKSRYRMGLTCHFAMLDPNVKIPPLVRAMHFGEDPCYRWNAAYRDWIWTKQYLNVLKSRSDGSENAAEERVCSGTFTYLADAEWAIATGKHQTAFAIKGGNNGEPHNHNDVGSFLYFIGEEEIISDLGAGEYTKAYFGPERYSVLCCSSRGHSVPILDGKEQCKGETYRADAVNYSETGEISISFAGAYEKESRKKLIRTAVFCRETGELQIKDCLKTAPLDNGFTENLVTRQNVSREKDRIRIGDRGTLKIDGVSPEKIQIIPCIHRDHQGKMETVFLIQWEADGKENIWRSRFVLCPE